jgi:hypothetical protein
MNPEQLHSVPPRPSAAAIAAAAELRAARSGVDPVSLAVPQAGPSARFAEVQAAAARRGRASEGVAQTARALLAQTGPLSAAQLDILKAAICHALDVEHRHAIASRVRSMIPARGRDLPDDLRKEGGL